MTTSARSAFTYEQVAARLSAELRRGLLRDGDALPPEAELARSLNVGRGTLRRALALLDRSGLITKGQGRRSVFRSRKVEAGGTSPAGLPTAARMAGLKQSTRLLWTRTRPAGLAEACALRISPGAQVAEICRLRLLAGRPAIRQLSVLPARVARRLPLDHTGSKSLYALMRSTLGTGIAVSEERISLSPLDADEARDLDQPSGQMAILVRRLVCGDGGEPLEYSVAAIVSPDVFFTLRTSRPGP